MQKLKERWGIDSNWQLIIIFIVFSVTGSSSVFVSRPIIRYLGVTPENLPNIIYYTLLVIFSIISYQILLVFFGWLFGQFEFFWNFEKKMLRRLGLSRFLD